MAPPSSLRRLLFPVEQIDRNANVLKRDLRRVYRWYRRGWLSKVECDLAGVRVIRRSSGNMQLRVEAYVERFGLVFGGDVGFLLEAEQDAVLRWHRCVGDFESRVVKGSVDVGVCSCSERRALAAASSSYWSSPSGLVRRMDGLAQDMNFRIVNNAMRMIAPLNGVQWLQWLTAADDRVCPLCVAAGKGGDGHGYYRVSWFMPQFPLHNGCRCELALLFYDPRQISLPRTS